MDNVEAKVRCLELAANVCRASGDHSPDTIVKTASTFYSFTQAPDQEAEPVSDADKPKRGKRYDILS